MINRSKSLAVTLVVGLLGLPSTGCTLIGMGAGASLPRYDSEAIPPSRMGALRIGEEIEIVRASDQATLRGPFGGIVRDELIISTNDGAVAIKPSDIDSLHVRRGSYWLPGLLIGLAADAVVIATYYALR